MRTKKARPAGAGRAVCERTPFRRIEVRRSLPDRRPPAPQVGGRNHEIRAGARTKFMSESGEPCCDVLVTREARQRWRRALSDSDPASPSSRAVTRLSTCHRRQGQQDFSCSTSRPRGLTTPRHRQAVRESTAIRGRASPHTVSESCVGLHSGSGLQGVRDTERLCARIDEPARGASDRDQESGAPTEFARRVREIPQGHPGRLARHG